MKARTIVFVLVGVLLLAGIGLGALAWHPALTPVDAPGAKKPDAALVARGATLAAIGDCTGCHSAPGKPPFSGGVPVETPFGVIYASNLTPDVETGLGGWSEQAFIRAMREGIDRAGRNLYPAFPYDHYTQVTDDDDRALYAYLQSRTPARQETPATTLPFPLDIRAVMAGWNLVFFHAGPYAPDPAHDATWNRGAYLVEGLGHCGACHTPRNAFGAERSGAALAGGLAEGWNAYALNAASPAPIPWTIDSLTFYLQHGFEAVHGVSRGPMAVVTANLGVVPEPDVRAMATYIVAEMGRPSADRRAAATSLERTLPAPLPAASAGSQIAVAAEESDRGAAVYAGACATCHESGRAVPFGGMKLGLSSALHAPDPANIVTVTLHGLAAPPGAPGAIMPGFAGSLDDAQIAALLAYLRADVAHEAPWPDLVEKVRTTRQRGATLYPSDGIARAPATTNVRVAP